MTQAKAAPKRINLALQGGGSHGAFAWGVLDKLLEDGRLEIEGLCATSAGTMNACAYAYGKMIGGPDKARETLHQFWWNIHCAGKQYSPIRRMPWDGMMQALSQHNPWNMDQSFSFLYFDALSRMFSPYQLNPFDFNPLRDVLSKTVDFEALRHCECTDLFVSATHVQTGKVRVFHNEEVTLDVAMASACLPFLFKAVSVDGEDYWDGGYLGNPAIYPLFYRTQSRDVMIIHINPLFRPKTPVTAPEILNRINEISFNASLIEQMRSIAFVKKLIEQDMLKDQHKDDFKNILLHSVRADEVMLQLSVASKFDTEWDFLTYLRDTGRAAMQAWLDRHFDDVNERDTVDVNGDYLASVTELFEDVHRHHTHAAQRVA
jgi:NTE family protein